MSGLLFFATSDRLAIPTAVSDGMSRRPRFPDGVPSPFLPRKERSHETDPEQGLRVRRPGRRHPPGIARPRGHRPGPDELLLPGPGPGRRPPSPGLLLLPGPGSLPPPRGLLLLPGPGE